MNRPNVQALSEYMVVGTPRLAQNLLNASMKSASDIESTSSRWTALVTAQVNTRPYNNRLDEVFY